MGRVQVENLALQGRKGQSPGPRAVAPRRPWGRGSRYSCTSMNPRGLSPSKPRDQDGAASRGPAPGSPGCARPRQLSPPPGQRASPPRTSSPADSQPQCPCPSLLPQQPFPSSRAQNPSAPQERGPLVAPCQASQKLLLHFTEILCHLWASPCNRDSRQGPGPAPAPRLCSQPWAQPGTEWVSPPGSGWRKRRGCGEG